MIRLRHLLLSAAVVSLVPATASHAVAQSTSPRPMTGPAPAPTATATAPADSPAQQAARTAARDFFKALRAGNVKTVLSLIAYENPDNQPVGDAMFSVMAAEATLHETARITFGDQAHMLSIAMTEEEFAAMERQFVTAPVVLTGGGGDTAELRVERAPALVLIHIDDAWKIDFEKTQAHRGPMPPKNAVASLQAQTAEFLRLNEHLLPLRGEVKKMQDDIDEEKKKQAREGLAYKPTPDLEKRANELSKRVLAEFDPTKKQIEAIRAMGRANATTTAPAPAATTRGLN